jgi:hypothetical protein
LGPQVRVGEQVIRRRLADSIVSQEGFEIGDVAGGLVDAMACSCDECAVPLDLLAVLVPGLAHLGGQNTDSVE